jgi:peptide subunit release factor 1 (eRF1)
VLSLYLNLAPDQHGGDNYDAFVRKTFNDRLKSLRQRSPERESFERDSERIRGYLEREVSPSRNGLALFACSGADDFFEAVQLDAPIDYHWLFVGDVPHLYPLVRLVDQYPRYAAVVLDSNTARIFVFALAAVEQSHRIVNEKTRRSAVGGWSQARYQRHAENFHLHHVKEVVEVLDRVVTSEGISHIVVAGDEVAVPVLRDQLPQHLSSKLVEVIRLDRSANESEILDATLEALKEKDAAADAEHVDRLISAWRSGGLGVVGPEATLWALRVGQVEELIIAGNPNSLGELEELPEDSPRIATTVTTSGPTEAVDEPRMKLSEELVTRAEQTGAVIRIVEDAALLADVGGVGALLRFRV